MKEYIFAINPGSTTTKLALYEGDTLVFSEGLDHESDVLARFSNLSDQYIYRKNLCKKLLEDKGYAVCNLACVVGRGGFLPPVKSGAYTVNEAMLQVLRSEAYGSHASNLGAMIAWALAEEAGVPAYVYDGVTSDEFTKIASVTGLPEIVRHNVSHVLNSKATARKLAQDKGTSYDKLNIIVAHLGGGISITAHEKGVMIDSIADDGGPFSPERAGSIPSLHIVDMCFSGKYTKMEMKTKIRGMGGLKAHLGTSDCRQIEKRIDQGDGYAALLYEAQAYQIAKGIGCLMGVFDGQPDYILLTGGLAYSEKLTKAVQKRVNFLAPVVLYPGENELEALAFGALRVLRGEEIPHIFTVED